MRHRWRVFLAIDLGLFNIALFVFALFPPGELLLQEWVAMGLAAFAFIGVAAHASPWIRLPLERYVYLITGAVGLYVFFAYLNFSPTEPLNKLPFLLFMSSGIASAYAAHVIDGADSHREHQGDG